MQPFTGTPDRSTAGVLLRANPTKVGDAELRGYSVLFATPAGPPAIELDHDPNRAAGGFSAFGVFRNTSERMLTSTREMEGRPDEWCADRDRYIVLQHLYNIREVDPGISLTAEKIARDLGFPCRRAEILVDSLILAEYLRYSGVGEGLVLTGRGKEYIERGAGRRRSVRLVH